MINSLNICMYIDILLMNFLCYLLSEVDYLDGHVIDSTLIYHYLSCCLSILFCLFVVCIPISFERLLFRWIGGLLPPDEPPLSKPSERGYFVYISSLNAQTFNPRLPIFRTSVTGKSNEFNHPIFPPFFWHDNSF